MNIGILTMHKVLNYGSALQAYALLHFVRSLGLNAELIDYIFPNRSKRKLSSCLLNVLSDIVTGKCIKERRFREFYKNYYRCSFCRYYTKQEFSEANLNYDILMTGSDQVWNPIHIKDDFSFFFPFVNSGKKKVSYASSFSVSTLPDNIKASFTNYLKTYSHISVREKSSVKIVKDLIDIEPAVVCDPTLLLTADDWSNMIANYPKPMKEPYILAYILRYSYDPYPEIFNIIEFVQKKYGYHVVMLDGSINDIKRKNTSIIKTAGPLEFLNWIKNASFIITTSFHGSAFALNFQIPFLSVIKDRTHSDNRMIDLLETCGCSDNIITYNQDLCDFSFKRKQEHIETSNKLLEKFRNSSIKYLKNSIL